MNATQFRTWLGNCTGKKLGLQPGYANIQGIASNVPNGSCQLYIPIRVTGVHKKRFGFAIGSPYKVQISNSGLAGANGVYLPDAVNECTRVDATNSDGIVISGRFSGCTFALCTDGAGVLWAGHVYVDASIVGNNPTNQARAFETACGAVANSAIGFQTAGQVQVVHGGAHGLVIGTDVGGWQWNWVVLDGGNPHSILSVTDITTAFVAL